MKFLNNLKISNNCYANPIIDLKRINAVYFNLNIYKKSIKNIYLIDKKIISLFIKKGKKNLLINNVSKAIKDFYFLFFYKTTLINFSDYLFLNEFKTQLLKSPSYFKIFFILYNVILDLRPFFFLKSSVIEKRFRKKKDEKYMYKITYILSKHRVKKSIKFFYLSFFKIKSAKISSRFLFLFLDIFLNYKKSYIYEYKISTYKKIFLN